MLLPGCIKKRKRKKPRKKDLISCKAKKMIEKCVNHAAVALVPLQDGSASSSTQETKKAKKKRKADAIEMDAINDLFTNKKKPLASCS